MYVQLFVEKSMPDCRLPGLAAVPAALSYDAEWVSALALTPCNPLRCRFTLADGRRPDRGGQL